jgi:hypothetical protein
MNIEAVRAAAEDGTWCMWHEPNGGARGPFQIELVTKGGVAIPRMYPELRIRPSELVPCVQSKYWARVLQRYGLPYDSKLLGGP